MLKLRYSRIPIFLTSRGNENWLEKLGGSRNREGSKRSKNWFDKAGFYCSFFITLKTILNINRDDYRYHKIAS